MKLLVGDVYSLVSVSLNAEESSLDLEHLV